MVDAYSVITVPTKPDLSKRVYGDAFSADDLHYLRTRDARAYYAIDDLLDAAFRRGFREKDDEVQEPAGKPPVDGEQKTAAPGSSLPKRPTGAQKKPKLTRDEDDDNSIDLHVPTMKKGWKFAAEYGWGLVVHYHEGENKLKEAMGEDESVQIQAFHPLVADFGGIKRWDTDEKTGLPKKFYIQPNAGIGTEIEVDASRCDIYTWGDISNAWQGYTSLGPSLDDIIGNRLWRATAGRRIRDYSTARYLIQKLNATAALDATEKAEIASAFAGVPHAAVPGEWKVDTVGGPTDTAELTLVTSAQVASVAVGQGINVSDMEGANAGAKLSTDSNMTSYDDRVLDIQMHCFPSCKKTLKRLGFTVTGFQKSLTLLQTTKLDRLTKLLDTYGSAAQELKEPIKSLLVHTFKQEFGLKIDFEVQEPEPIGMDANGQPINPAGQPGAPGAGPPKQGFGAKLKSAFGFGKKA